MLKCNTNFVKRILGCLCLTTILLTGCGQNTTKEEVVVDENAPQLYETEDFTNKDYITITSDSVFYNAPLTTITPHIGIATPNGATINEDRLIFQNENIDISIRSYTHVFDMFQTEDDLKFYITDTLTSMDDPSAIYTRYVFETLYVSLMDDMKLIDSLAYPRSVYTSNNVDYFAIREIRCAEDQKMDVLMFIDDDTASMIVVKYYFENEKSLQELENFKKTIMADKYVKISSACETELYVWRPAPDIIEISD